MSDHACNTCGYSWSQCFCPPGISDAAPSSPLPAHSTNVVENKPIRVEFDKRMRSSVNFGWPGYDFYDALKIIHQYLPCGSHKDKDILVPSNFQFEAGGHYARIASFDVAVMRFCERSFSNPAKGDNPIWRIYPTVVEDLKLIGFEYMPINTELT